MEVKQIYNLMNDVTEEILGTSELVKEDLSNVVDIGTSIFNNTNVDNYVKTLLNKIGKTIFVERVYQGALPSIQMDSWEFGSVLEKIQADIPEATENESWELTNGESYDPNVFTSMSISVKYFNSKVTFEIPISIADRQVKESFKSATQLNSFISMIYNAVNTSMTIKIDSLTMRTINTVIAETLYSDYTTVTEGAATTANFNSKSGIKAVNLLYLYNNKFDTELTADTCLTDPDFIKFANMTMGVYIDRLKLKSTLFNVEGKERFTSKDYLKFITLSEFDKASQSYLYSDTYHEEYTKLPSHDSIPYWQGSGTNYDFSDTSKINVKTSSNHEVEASGILAVMVDKDCIGVTNLSNRVTTNYNPKAEFTNSWFKFDCGYFADLSENAVVFFVA